MPRVVASSGDTCLGAGQATPELAPSHTAIGGLVHAPAGPAVDQRPYVPPALAEPGSHFTIRCDNRAVVSARAVATPFYDPDNERQGR